MATTTQQEVYRTRREAEAALAACPWREGDVVLHRGGRGRLIEAPYVTQHVAPDDCSWDESKGWTVSVGVCRLPFPGAAHTTGQPTAVSVAGLRRPTK